ncbi:MAG TPA: hypothetical protein PLF13_06800 [candidate division Zixibacteria bacterium]|nr:hypothetical protein [candidate division Zixibacteria bacterium]
MYKEVDSVLKAGALLLLISFMTISSAFSQVDSSDSRRAGDWALQFQLADDFDIQSFQGTTISLKKFHGINQATRLGLTLSGRYLDSDGVTVEDDTLTATGTNESNNFEIGLRLQRLWYRSTADVTSFYFGLGPDISFYRSKTNSVTVNSDGRIRDSRNLVRRWGMGASMVAGVEWFVHRAVSISAEYNLLALYSHEKQETDYTIYGDDGSVQDISESDSSSDSFTLDNAEALIGLSFFF